MKNRTMIKTGLIGTAIVAICCFTPILVILLGTIGLSALTGYLDVVLLPALLIFACMVIYGYLRKKDSCCEK